MSAVSLPVNRPVGRALIIAAPAARGETVRVLAQLGYEHHEADDPYAGFIELCKHRQSYQAVILGLSSLYREELTIIIAIKRRMPHLEVWLTQTEGRLAALADGVRLGADGLLADDGLHRMGADDEPAKEMIALRPAAAVATNGHVPNDEQADELPAEMPPLEMSLNEPVLTSDELRALLQEQPISPHERP